MVFPFEVYVATVLTESQSRNAGGALGEVLCFSTGLLLGTIPAGALFGYLAGCAMGGIFFVQESLRRRWVQPVTIELRPFTAADFDTLISWVRYPQLFDLWSQGAFHYPLDHDQLAAHLGLSGGEPPACLCFKAVCGEMQEMVAYVELANIDREKPRAAVEAGLPPAFLARAATGRSHAPASSWPSSTPCETIGAN